MSFDPSVVVGGHIRWQLLSTTEQNDLIANYPIHPSAPAPAAEVFGDAVDPRFQAWLDSAYVQRHATDTLVDPDDPAS